MLTAKQDLFTALASFAEGRPLILSDNPQRENEGDLIFPAELITPEIINFMLRHGSGIICLPLPVAQLQRLGISYMVPPQENTSARGTPFTVSIDAATGVSTGVSAGDRAHTILTAIQASVTAADIVKPGHIFPLQAQVGGVLARAGHTEGALDLMKLAGYQPAAVICELMNPDGSMMRGRKLTTFAARHKLAIVSIDDLIIYRRCHENLITATVSASLPLAAYGEFTVQVVKEQLSTKEHVVLIKEPFEQHPQGPLVRIHSACTTGDIFGSLRCDCQQQLAYALQQLSKEGGMLIYLQQEGRDIGLFNKIKAYALQDQGSDTIVANQQLGLPIDGRDYYLAANILRNQQLSKVRLLTNNPHKVADLQRYGIKEVQMLKMPVFCNKANKDYLLAKKTKLQHHIDL
jgi:3,4-dihydroxy 2-butanone 4-phosphate synthase/GTP cyclohydrolase II